LIQLAVLAVRYRLSYADETDTDWVGSFQTDIPFFESLVKISPQRLAELITDSDVINFHTPSLQNIIDNKETFRNIGREWNQCSLAVREAALVDQHFAKKALEVAKASQSDPLCFPASLI